MSNNSDETNDISHLYQKIKDLRKNILELKIKKAYDDFKDTSQIRKNRREVASLLTKINQIKKSS